MKLHLKNNVLRAASLALLLVCAGCGGLNASHSISPASFFFPGLLKADPPPDQQPDPNVPHVQPVKQLAQLQ